MKKHSFYLFAMLCTLSLFSCGDDNGKDEPGPGLVTDNSWKEIAKDYTGDKLNLQFNDQALTTNTIKLETSSADKGAISLGDLIGGVPGLKIDVTLKTTKAEAAVIPNYAIEGQKTIDSRTITVTGGVASGVLSLNVKVKVASSIVGRWGLAMEPTPSDINGDGVINEMDYNLMAGCFFLSLESQAGIVTFEGQSIPDMQFCMYADNKAEAAIRAFVEDITFYENGNLVLAQYVKEGVALPYLGMAGYYIKDNVLYVTLNVKSIMDLLSSKADSSPLVELLAMAQNGIPMAYIPSEDGKSCKIAITKEIATQLIPKLTPLMDLLPTMIPGLDENPEAAAMFEQIGSLLQTIATSKEFSVGLNLVKK